jgi:hypothetical protein
MGPPYTLYYFPGWTFFLGGASPQRGLAPPMSPFPFRNLLLKTWHRVTRRAPKGHGTWVYDPPSPRPSPPLIRGERVEGVGGCNTNEW